MAEVTVERSGRNYLRLARTGVFYLVGIVFVALLVLVAGFILELGIRSWFSTVAGDHRIHEIMLTGLLLVATAGIVIQAYRPKVQVAALQTAIVLLFVATVLTGVTGGPAEEPGSFFVLALLMGVLHPSGRELLRPFTAGRFSFRLAGLVVIAAVPLVAFALDQATFQTTLTDEHAAFSHYADQASYVLGSILVGLLAAVKTRGWLFPAIATGLLALNQGFASIFFETTSSVGMLWGILEVAWAVAFLVVAAIEYQGVMEESAAKEREPAGAA